MGSRWIARAYVTTPEGRKRRSWSGKTKAEARDRMLKAIQESKQGYGAALSSERLTLKDYLDDWLSSSKGSVSASTYERYEQYVRCRIVPALGAVPLKKLNPGHVDMLKTSLAQDLEPSTVNQALVVLSAALNRAVKWDFIPKNPVKAVKKLKETDDGLACLSEEEAGRLVEVARDSSREALYLVALKCGLRQGELLGLRWEDIEGRKLTVRNSVDTSRKEPRWGATKGGRERSIVLAPSLIEALKRHRHRQAEERLRAPWWENLGLVYPNEFGGLQRAPMVLLRLRKDLEKAGLPRIRFHDLRDTCATLLLGKGVPLHVVARILGHKDPAITLRRYAHVLPDSLEDAAERVEGLAF